MTDGLSAGMLALLSQNGDDVQVVCLVNFLQLAFRGAAC